MATITEIQNIINKGKSGQFITIQVGTDKTNLNAQVVSLDTSKFGSIKAEDWTEGWDGPGGAGDADEVDNSEWGVIVQALENCSPSDFNTETLAYTGNNATLQNFALGAGVADMKYKVYSAQDPVNTTWINLGFNASIPEYVKYRKAVGSGYKHIWIKSTKLDILAAIGVGDKVYTRAYNSTTYGHDYTEVDGETVTSVSGTFEYGNLNKYAVPTKVTTSAGEYDFCGYNITLNSQAILNVEGQNTLAFNPSTSPYNNAWSDAPLRLWLNSDSTVTGMSFHGSSGDAYTGLISRLTSNDGLMANITKAVNRTWVYPDFRSGKTLDGEAEHIVDKFWLLGIGNIRVQSTNWINESFQDQINDTFKSYHFPDADNNDCEGRVKFNMTTTGSTSSSAGYWWLRSAGSNRSNYAGFVNYYGYVYYDGVRYSNDYGASPACLIG